jgi:hypothetical protein
MKAKPSGNRRGVGRVRSIAEASNKAAMALGYGVWAVAESVERRVAPEGRASDAPSRQEPGAGKPHAGICAGGAQQ